MVEENISKKDRKQMFQKTFRLTPWGFLEKDWDHVQDVPIVATVYKQYGDKTLKYYYRSDKPVYITNKPDLIEAVIKNPDHYDHQANWALSSLICHLFMLVSFN